MSNSISHDRLIQELTSFLTEEIIQDAAGSELAPDDDLLEGSLVDSMGVMRLTLFIEETYSYAVPAEDVTIENFATVDAIANYLLSSLPGEGQ